VPDVTLAATDTACRRDRFISQTGRDFYGRSWQIPAQWRSTDGLTHRLDCITDDRGLLSLSVRHKAFVPRWLYGRLLAVGTGWYCAPGYLP